MQQQIIDEILYTQLLKNFLVLFVKESFHGMEYHFMQDNVPKHTSHVAKAFYMKRGINWWPIAKTVEPVSKHVLIEGICSGARE